MFSKHISVKYFNFLHKGLYNNQLFCSKYTGIPLILVFQVYPAALLTLSTIDCLRFFWIFCVYSCYFLIKVLFLPLYFTTVITFYCLTFYYRRGAVTMDILVLFLILKRMLLLITIRYYIYLLQVTT